MKLRKLLIAFLLLLSIFLIYVFTKDDKINYIAIGDSLSAGQNPYGQISYGYSDYVKDYLEKNDLLRFYTKKYATSDYTIKELLTDIKENKKITQNGQSINIKKALREADLLTITIGTNDLINDLKFNTDLFDLMNEKEINKEIDKNLKNIEEVLKEVKKYAKNEIIVIGYYNPFPKKLLLTQNKIDKIFKIINERYKLICNNNSITYVDIYADFKSNADFLPNPLDIHPNNKGYELIGNRVIDTIEKKILN